MSIESQSRLLGVAEHRIDSLIQALRRFRTAMEQVRIHCADEFKDTLALDDLAPALAFCLGRELLMDGLDAMDEEDQGGYCEQTHCSRCFRRIEPAGAGRPSSVLIAATGEIVCFECAGEAPPAGEVDVEYDLATGPIVWDRNPPGPVESLPPVPQDGAVLAWANIPGVDEPITDEDVRALARHLSPIYDPSLVRVPSNLDDMAEIRKRYGPLPEKRGYPAPIVTEEIDNPDCKLEVVMVRPGTCPDCRGSGQYVGLTTSEPCAACGGTGARRT